MPLAGNSLWRDWQMTGRGSNLDSNLNSAAWPTNCKSFYSLGNHSINCVKFQFVFEVSYWSQIWAKRSNFYFACLNLGIFSQRLKPLYFVGQVADCKFEFKFEPLSYPCWSSGNHSRRQSQKTIKGWLKHQWFSSWACTQVQLRLIGWAGTNTGRFWVSCSWKIAVTLAKLTFFWRKETVFMLWQ